MGQRLVEHDPRMEEMQEFWYWCLFRLSVLACDLNDVELKVVHDAWQQERRLINALQFRIFKKARDSYYSSSSSLQ